MLALLRQLPFCCNVKDLSSQHSKNTRIFRVHIMMKSLLLLYVLIVLGSKSTCDILYPRGETHIDTCLFTHAFFVSHNTRAATAKHDHSRTPQLRGG
jgi:hypothetical protein